MNKLIAKFLTVSITALAISGLFACTEGTAEEPNQFAVGNFNGTEEIESSSSDAPNDTSDSATSLTNSSSSKHMAPSSNSSYASSPAMRNSSSSKDSIDNPPIAVSSSSPGVPIAFSSSVGQFGGGGGFSGYGHAGSIDSNKTLDIYLLKYKVPNVTFDENVLAYNKTFEGCDATKETCFESPGITELRKIGLHKATTPKEFNDLSFIFPATAKAMGGSLHEVNNCPLYVLNINETSPAVHVLTRITKDTLTIATFYDNCDYERSPFDIYVGFLFSYCGELSENPEIIMTSTLNESMTCGTITYEEYTKSHF